MKVKHISSLALALLLAINIVPGRVDASQVMEEMPKQETMSEEKDVENPIPLSDETTKDDETKAFEEKVAKAKEELKKYIDSMDEEEKAMGLVGEFESEYSLEELDEFFKEKLQVKKIKYYGRFNRKIKKVAILGGSGADFINLAKNKGVDAYITSDIKYHDGQRAYEEDFILIDLGHFYSERIILPKIKKRLQENFKELNFYIQEESSFELDI